MDASLPTGKELRLLNATGTNSRLPGSESFNDVGRPGQRTELPTGL